MSVLVLGLELLRLEPSLVGTLHRVTNRSRSILGSAIGERWFDSEAPPGGQKHVGAAGSQQCSREA